MTKTHTRSLTFLSLLLLSFILIACGSTPPAANTAAPAATDAVPFVGAAAPTEAPAVSGEPVVSGETDTAGIPVGFTEDGRPYRGRPDAPVVMEMFSDYQCPFCESFTKETLPSLLENQIAGGEVVLIFHDFPLNSIHPQAAAAGNAARCAGEEGAAAYWAMHDRLFLNVAEWANDGVLEVLRGYGAELGLNAETFGACLDENRYADAVAADLALGEDRGVNSTPSFFLNDQPVVGAYPLDYFNEAIAKVGGGEVIATEPEVSDPSVPPTPAAVVMDDIAAERGDPGAVVTLVEFTDYQCPFCARHASDTMPRLLSEMVESGRVRYVIKDFPLESIHAQARAAAVAARCAGEQGAYWQMHDALFARQAEWSVADPTAVFSAIATELGLDGGAFATCQTSGRFDAIIQQNLDEGSALGVTGTPSFFINGFPVSGAQQYELFEYAIGLAEAGTLADAYVQTAEEVAAAAATPTPAGPVEVDISGGNSFGDPNAPVTMVEFTDYQCPFCSRHFAETFPQIMTDYVDTGKVRYVILDFPLSNIHPQAQLAAEAARCAGAQSAYEPMHHALFEGQEEWGGRADASDVFKRYATELGLDAAAFGECLDGGQFQAAVLASLQQGQSLGVNGTPAFFLNGNFISGAQPYAVFQQAIENLLAEEG